MAYPVQKRTTNHPILRFGSRMESSSWSFDPSLVVKTFMRKSNKLNKWLVVKSPNEIVFKGDYNRCLRYMRGY